MKFIGLFLLLAGLVSLLLPLIGGNLLVLNWLNQWGDTASWAIRVGITILGLVLFFANRHDD